MQKVTMYKMRNGKLIDNQKEAVNYAENQAADIMTTIAHQTAGKKYVDNLDYLMTEDTQNAMREALKWLDDRTLCGDDD
jgi:hypothetical protein